MSKYLPLILATVLLNAASQVLMKRGMLAVGRFEYEAGAAASLMLRAAMHPSIVIAVLLMGLSMVTYLMSLSRFEVSYAMPFMGLGYVLVTMYAYFFLSESLGPWRIVGIALICIGTALVARN